MMEFTRRMAGAASASSSSTASSGVWTAPYWPPIRSRRMSSMACMAPWLLYRFWTARSRAAEAAMTGITLRRVTACTSSTATKFSGSAMASFTSVRLARMGSTMYFFAMALGRSWAISGGMAQVFRSTNSTPSWSIRVSISCFSVMKPCFCSTAPRRSPLPDWRASASSSCPWVMVPLLTSRSPSRMYFMEASPLPLSCRARSGSGRSARSPRRPPRPPSRPPSG